MQSLCSKLRGASGEGELLYYPGSPEDGGKVQVKAVLLYYPGSPEDGGKVQVKAVLLCYQPYQS